MFDELKAAFREAVENFKEELHRDEIPESMDHLLQGMSSQVTSEKVRLEALEGEVREVEARAIREEKEAATCRRRARLAREIGDDETARIASEFASKHERRLGVFEEKARALRKELRLREGELDEMLERIRAARAQREGLEAAARRGRARTAMGGADELLAELERIGDQISDADRRARATAALDFEPPGPDPKRTGPRLDDADRDAEAEARLRELKREVDRERS